MDTLHVLSIFSSAMAMIKDTLLKRKGLFPKQYGLLSTQQFFCLNTFSLSLNHISTTTTTTISFSF